MDDPSLDIYSPSFDALKVLYSDTFKPPKDVAPLDYIAKCRVLLPTWEPDYLKPTKPAAKVTQSSSHETKGPESKPENPAAPEAVAAAKPENPATKVKIPTMKDHLFDQIADKYVEGPMSMLRILFKEKARVAVYIRRVKDMRGVCIGNLVAFDKHFNLILKDVTDEYTVPTRKRTLGDGSEDSEKFVTVLEKKTRHLPQLFIKGDSVALVVRAQVKPAQEASATSASHKTP